MPWPPGQPGSAVGDPHAGQDQAEEQRVRVLGVLLQDRLDGQQRDQQEQGHADQGGDEHTPVGHGEAFLGPAHALATQPVGQGQAKATDHVAGTADELVVQADDEGDGTAADAG